MKTKTTWKGQKQQMDGSQLRIERMGGRGRGRRTQRAFWAPRTASQELTEAARIVVVGAEGVARSACVPGAADAVICSAHVVCVPGAEGVDRSGAHVVVAVRRASHAAHGSSEGTRMGSAAARVPGAEGVDGSSAWIVVAGAECVGCHERVPAQRRVS